MDPKKGVTEEEYLKSLTDHTVYDHEACGEEDQNTDMELINRNIENEPAVQRKPVKLNVKDEPFPF